MEVTLLSILLQPNVQQYSALELQHSQDNHLIGITGYSYRISTVAMYGVYVDIAVQYLHHHSKAFSTVIRNGYASAPRAAARWQLVGIRH